MKKKLKKMEKKRVRLNNQQIFLLPVFMYAGAGRHMVSFDNKRKYVKMSQIQELILHTLPLGALIWYNNTTDIEYDETLFLVTQIVFIASITLNLIEIVAFYIYKAAG